MSDLTLSQEEIDALLMGPSSKPAAKKSMGSDESGAFKGLFDDAQGGLNNALSGLMGGKKIILSPPVLDLTDKDAVLEALGDEVVELQGDFTGAGATEHFFYLDTGDAMALASGIIGQDEIDLNDSAVSALEELASNFTGSLVTSFGKAPGGKDVTPGPVKGQKIVKAMSKMSNDPLVRVVWSVAIDGVPKKITEVYSYDFLKKLADVGASSKSSDPFASQPSSGFNQNQQFQQQNQNFMSNQGQQMQGGMMGMGQGMQMPQFNMPPNQQGMMGQPQGYGMPMGYGYPPPGGYPSVQGIQLPSLTPSSSHNENGNIGLLMDVSMEVTVELGRARKQIKEILSMGEGTIIALDKLAGEPVDILVNHKLIAKGEVVVIDENFGVRVTEIVTNPDKALEP